MSVVEDGDAFHVAYVLNQTRAADGLSTDTTGRRYADVARRLALADERTLRRAKTYSDHMIRHRLATNDANNSPSALLRVVQDTTRHLQNVLMTSSRLSSTALNLLYKSANVKSIFLNGTEYIFSFFMSLLYCCVIHFQRQNVGGN